jgi:Sulfotransferase family
MTEQVTVLYIGGRGRSGSTILARTLGQIPGFVNVGELWQVWNRGLRENERCGCGQPFYSCEFWRAVGDEAFGGWDNVDVDRMVAFLPYLKRQRYAPHYALAAMTSIRSRKMNLLLEECDPILERLHRAIQRVSGAEVIVDSSKRFSYAVVLSLLPFADLRVVHLVRDSRAVAYSWTKHKARLEVVDRQVFMPRLGPLKASRAWTLQNFLYSLLSGFTTLSRLRYEDFVNDPTFYLAETLTRVGFDDEAGSLPVVLGREISLSVEHTVSGNPGRFRTGNTELQADEEWKVKMRGADKNVVTALTAPLLLKYGYLGRKQTSNWKRY